MNFLRSLKQGAEQEEAREQERMLRQQQQEAADALAKPFTSWFTPPADSAPAFLPPSAAGSSESPPGVGPPMEQKKIVMVGNIGVGKTTLLQRFANQVSPSTAIPHDIAYGTGRDCLSKDIELDGRQVKLQIWDPAGQERFGQIDASFFHGTDGALVLFDVANRQSFASVAHWVKEIRRHARLNVKVVLVAHKCDRADAVVSSLEGIQLAEVHNIAPCIHVSAKDDINVEQPFYDVTRQIFSVEDEIAVLEQTSDQASENVLLDLPLGGETAGLDDNAFMTMAQLPLDDTSLLGPGQLQQQYIAAVGAPSTKRSFTVFAYGDGAVFTRLVDRAHSLEAAPRHLVRAVGPDRRAVHEKEYRCTHNGEQYLLNVVVCEVSVGPQVKSDGRFSARSAARMLGEQELLSGDANTVDSGPDLVVYMQPRVRQSRGFSTAVQESLRKCTQAHPMDDVLVIVSREIDEVLALNKQPTVKPDASKLSLGDMLAEAQDDDLQSELAADGIEVQHCIRLPALKTNRGASNWLLFYVLHLLLSGHATTAGGSNTVQQATPTPTASQETPERAFALLDHLSCAPACAAAASRSEKTNSASRAASALWVASAGSVQRSRPVSVAAPIGAQDSRCGLDTVLSLLLAAGAALHAAQLEGPKKGSNPVHTPDDAADALCDKLPAECATLVDAVLCSDQRGKRGAAAAASADAAVDAYLPHKLHDAAGLQGALGNAATTLQSVVEAYQAWVAARTRVSAEVDRVISSAAGTLSSLPGEDGGTNVEALAQARDDCLERLKNALAAADPVVGILAENNATEAPLSATVDQCMDGVSAWTKQATALSTWMMSQLTPDQLQRLFSEYRSETTSNKGEESKQEVQDDGAENESTTREASRVHAAMSSWQRDCKTFRTRHHDWIRAGSGESAALERAQEAVNRFSDRLRSSMLGALDGTQSGQEAGDAVIDEGSQAFERLAAELNCTLSLDVLDGVPVFHLLHACRTAVRALEAIASECSHIAQLHAQALHVLEEVEPFVAETSQELVQVKAEALVREVAVSKKVSRNLRHAQVDLDEAKEAVTEAVPDTEEAMEAKEEEQQADERVQQLQRSLHEMQSGCRKLRSQVFREVSELAPELILSMRGLRDSLLLKSVDPVLSTSGIFSENMSLETSYANAELMAGRAQDSDAVASMSTPASGGTSVDSAGAGGDAGIVHSMNMVYKCERLGISAADTEDPEKRFVVVKQYDQGNVAQARRLQRQLRLLHDLRHFNLVELSAVFADSRRVYIETPFYGGGTLSDVIAEGAATDNAPWRKQLFADTLQALGHLHAHNIVHCDIKPGNVFISLATGRARLGDFDAARREASAGDLATTSVFAAQLTRRYAAPEVLGQVHSNDARNAVAMLTTRADMYSAGMVLRELFDSDDVKSTLDTEDTSALAELLRLLLHEDPIQRPSAAQCLEWPFFRWSMNMAQAAAAQRVAHERLQSVEEELSSLQSTRAHLQSAQDSAVATREALEKQMAEREAQLRSQQQEIQQARDALRAQQQRVTEATERQQRELQQLREQQQEQEQQQQPHMNALSGGAVTGASGDLLAMMGSVASMLEQVQQEQAQRSAQEDAMASQLAKMEQRMTGMHRRRSSRYFQTGVQTVAPADHPSNEATREVAQQLAEMNAMLQKFQGNQAEVASLVRELVHSETECPNYPILVPEEAAQMQRRRRWGGLFSSGSRSCGSMFRKHFRLFFVCPVTGQCAESGPDGQGYLIKQPRDWVKRLTPVLEKTVQVLRVAGAVAGAVLTAGATLPGTVTASMVTGIAEDDDGSASAAALADLLNNVVEAASVEDEVSGAGSGAPGGAVRPGPGEPGTTGDEYQQLFALLRTLDAGLCGGSARPSQTGLVRVTGGQQTDAMTLWVHPSAQQEFSQRGRAMLRRNIAEQL